MSNNSGRKSIDVALKIARRSDAARTWGLAVFAGIVSFLFMPSFLSMFSQNLFLSLVVGVAACFGIREFFIKRKARQLLEQHDLGQLKNMWADMNGFPIKD